MATFTLTAEAAAPPDVVFEVLTDHRRYADISRLRSSELEREGDPAPNGVGAIRVLKAAGPPLREEVVEYEPNKRFVYKLLSGAPLKDHVGTVQLIEAATGTHIVYDIRTTPRIPIVGRAVVAITRTAVKQLLDGIVKESERRAAAQRAAA